MPRMSKQRRLEWSFFLDHRNRISYHGLQFFFRDKLKPAAEAKPLLPVSWQLFMLPK